MNNIEFAEGVAIIAKYLTEENKESYNLQAEHDQIWFCDCKIVKDNKDAERLVELGWFCDEDSWSCFP